MNAYTVEDNLETIGSFVQIVADSDNSLDFCKRIVHSDRQGLIVGCQLYFLDNKGEFKQVSSYGKQPEQPEENSAFGDNPLAQAIRQKTAVVTHQDKQIDASASGHKFVTFPFIRGSEPVGVMQVVVEADTVNIDLDDNIIETVSKLGAHYLETVGVKSEKAVGVLGDSNVDALTDRQITVLKFMGQGLTNAQIATELMLSESSIRQETVRIYRALGVKSRHQAAVKARALGIIPKRETSN